MTAEFSKMFSLNGYDMCIICLDLKKSIKQILHVDENGVGIENKLKFIISEEDLTSHYNKIKHFEEDSPKRICDTCLKELNSAYNFKSKCLRNLTYVSKFIDKKTVNHKDVPLEVSTTLLENAFERSENETTTKQNKELDEIKIKQEPVEEHVKIENATVYVEILKPVEEVNIKKEPGSDPLSMETEADPSKQLAAIEDSLQQLTGEKSPNCLFCYQSPCGLNLYRCGQCDFYFSDVRPLMIHIRTHTEDKPFHCNICDKKISCKDHLVLHLERHRLHITGERPYKCDVCEKTFIQSDNLRKHMKTHATKSYECDVCNKIFRRYCELTMHKRIHNNIRPHACSICEKTFRQNEHLKNHMRTHTKERPFPCTFCDYRAAIKTSLDSHVKRMHKIKKIENVLNVVPVEDVIRLHVVQTEADENTSETEERTEEEEKIEVITGV